MDPNLGLPSGLTMCAKQLHIYEANREESWGQQFPSETRGGKGDEGLETMRKKRVV